ncbi:hypothetical protein HanIR_Chr02g0062621 [Helianthus annuus]|nr:hypothetical protein HanIR_Chr02g0062621 [Helianthus annuus]
MYLLSVFKVNLILVVFLTFYDMSFTRYLTLYTYTYGRFFRHQIYFKNLS